MLPRATSQVAQGRPVGSGWRPRRGAREGQRDTAGLLPPNPPPGHPPPGGQDRGNPGGCEPVPDPQPPALQPGKRLLHPPFPPPSPAVTGRRHLPAPGEEEAGGTRRAAQLHSPEERGTAAVPHLPLLRGDRAAPAAVAAQTRTEQPYRPSCAPASAPGPAAPAGRQGRGRGALPAGAGPRGRPLCGTGWRGGGQSGAPEPLSRGAAPAAGGRGSAAPGPARSPRAAQGSSQGRGSLSP